MKRYEYMKRPLFGALASSALLFSLGTTAAQAQQSIPTSQAEGSNLWFVELKGAPEADGNSKAAVKAEKAAFRAAAAAAGVNWKERRSYDVLFNGFAVEATPADRTKLAMLSGFKAMYPIEIIQAPTPEIGGGTAADLANAVAMTGANIAQADGFTGAGIKVGIVDSGIDIDHRDLGGTGTNRSTPFPSARVAYGYDFVGDAYNADPTSATYNPNPSPDANPDDCGGHGTHVSGIVGANGTVKGVAPGVTFGAYRVFGCAGSTSSDIILAALERALADGMQVVNQSLGASRQWPQYPTAVAATRLAKKGVVVVASIGNSGPGGNPADGLYAAGAPGVGEGVIGVASFDNTRSTKLAFSATPDNRLFGYARATGAPPSPLTGSLPMSKTGTTATLNDGCPPWQASFGGIPWLGGAWLPQGSQSGKAVLIRRGTCSFYAKALNAQLAGAAAVVLYNNAAGELTPTVAGTPAITVPVVLVSQADGAVLDARIAAGATSMTWTANTVSAAIATGGLISSFSSFGLAADLSLKPNLGAPGGSIYSTYPIELGNYATLSGTSMSSPHVAGAAALVLQARPKTSPAEMKVLLQNGADPKLWNLIPGLGFLDNVHRQGAGMIDIPQAIGTATTVTPSELSLGESAAKPQRIKLQINSNSRTSVTYNITHEPALATAPKPGTSGTFVGEIDYWDAFATVTFEKSTVKVQGPSVENLDVTITAPAGLPDRGIYGGYIVLTPQSGGQPLRVPYAGFKGDYQAIRVLAPTASGYPWLAKLLPCTPPTPGSCYFNQLAGASYTLAGNDVPFFLIHLDHHSEAVRLEALDMNGNVVGQVSLDEWVTRNSSATGAFAFAWDGNVYRKDPSKDQQWSSVPNGDYFVRVSVTKALAEKNNADHVEIWRSPKITIARP